MKPKLSLSAFIFFLATFPFLVSCEPDDEPVLSDPEISLSEPESPADKENNGENSNELTSRNMTILIGNTSFTVTLDDSETVRKFIGLLPMTLNMSELNGNEKYHNLSQSLPAASNSSGNIKKGDLMLYGANCIVLFYKDFSTGYSYTRLGKIDNPDGLEEAVGKGSVTVTFKMTPLE